MTVTPTNGRVTLATIADAAGVSVATVSKVINGRSDVAPATRAAVQDALDAHSYSPRRAPARRSAPLELLFHGPLTAYSVEVLAGVLGEAASAPVDVVVSIRSRPPTGGTRVTKWVRELIDADRQALIAVTSEFTPADVALLSRAPVALVVIDPINVPTVEIASVGSTNFTGGLAATQHLLGLGHRRVAYLGGPVTAACNQARLQGFRGAMDAAGEPVPPEYLRFGRFEYEDGLEQGAALLQLREPPTAVFAANDEMALGVMEAARSRGLRIPEDLSVVGFDDTRVAWISSPPLTTVAQPLRSMGAIAVRTALRLAGGEPIDSHHVELATELKVRASTAPPK
jgi:LacI family transcriptional regulator